MVYAGQGDARRSMALLWRAEGAPGVRSAPGPKPGLSVDLIVNTGIAVADEQGMAALSMRAVGERLGRTAMALYTYVPGKTELVDLMYDRALAQLPTGYSLEAGWRPALTAWAHDNWTFYVRHPWVLQVSQARPVLGPNEFRTLDTVLGILAETGLEARLRRGIVTTLFDIVRGAARTVAEARLAPKETGVPEDEWWLARSAMLEEVAPDFAERYPLVTRLENEGAFTPEECGPYDECVPYLENESRRTFETGLTLFLDGIEAAMRAAYK